MTETRFPPHGQFRMGIVERVYCLEIVDAWNMEALTQYLEAFRSAIGPLLDGQPWASLVDITQATLPTYDTLKPFNQMVRQPDFAGRTHMAVVGVEDDMRRQSMQVLFAGTGVVIRECGSLSEGWRWLQKEGFCAGEPNQSPYR